MIIENWVIGSRGISAIFSSESRYGNAVIQYQETLSWVCILGAFPFAAMGFIKYNGMTAEQFVWAWIKSEFLMPKKLMFLPDNLYYETMKQTIEAHEKGLPTVRKKQKGRTPKPKKTKKKKAKRSKEVNNAENS